MWIYSSLLFSAALLFNMLKLQYLLLCRCGPQRPCMKFIGPRVPPFDTQDMANRFCAISHFFQLLCKADLSCLQAIFKPWAPETYGATGNFIISALHLSDLIPARRRLCRSAPYIYTQPGQTRAPVTNPTINILAGVTPGEAFLWTVLRNRDYGYYLQCTSPAERSKRNEGKRVILFHQVEGWPKSQAQRDLTFWRISVGKMSQISATDALIRLFRLSSLQQRVGWMNYIRLNEHTHTHTHSHSIVLLVLLF